MTDSSLLDRSPADWTCPHITDEIVQTNGCRLNLDLAARVRRARESLEYSVAAPCTVIHQPKAGAA